MPTSHVPLGSGSSGGASVVEGGSWGGATVFLYFLSGITALAYQVLWARILSLQFGVSIFGVTVTVVAFMLGLGVGSLWGGRLKLRVHPLIFFALLELSVAVFAFIIPRLFGWVNAEINQADVVSGLMGWYGLQFVVTLAMLFLPATLLGLSFPTILRAVNSLPVTLGAIYGANALGGAIGAILPLVLLPVLGWLVSNALIALLGVVISLFAFWLSFKIKAPSQAVVMREAAAREDSRRGEATLAWGSALAYACVGAAGLMLEVGWTRLYGMILLRTEYVMAVILAVFLMGIAFGSLVVKRNVHERWLTLLPIVGSFFALLSLWGLPWLAEWMESSRFDSLGSALFFQALVIALLTLPVTMALGAWLPMLSIKLGNANAQLGARLYGVNSVGAALGAIIAGLLVIPHIGTPATIVIAALLMFIAGMHWSSRRRAWLVLVPLIAMALPVVQLPAVQVLLPVTQRDSRDLYQHEDAISITHVVERGDGQRLLLDDLQRMDASTDPAAVSAQQNQARLPLMLHPNPRSVLFLGVGTGISVSGSLPYDALRRVGVELSQGAISAMQPWFGVVNGDVLSKMEVVRDDARRFLQRSTDRFDVIIGDLFPWSSLTGLNRGLR